MDIEVSGLRCTINGQACEQRSRAPGALFFVADDGGAIQFTAPQGTQF